RGGRARGTRAPGPPRGGGMDRVCVEPGAGGEVHPLRVTRGALRASTVFRAGRTRDRHSAAEGSGAMSTYDRPVKGMAGAMFAAIMMVTLGVFQAIEGLVALFND